MRTVRVPSDDAISLSRTMVRHAVCEGLLPASPPCRVCGAPWRRGSVRHHQDYARPLWVIPLCGHHHQEAHAGRLVFEDTRALRSWERGPRELTRALRHAAVSAHRPHGMSVETFRAEMASRDLLWIYESARGGGRGYATSAARRGMLAALDARLGVAP